VKYRLSFSKEILNKPVISGAIIDTKVPINMIEGKIGKEEGYMIVDVPGDTANQNKVLKYLRGKGVEVKKFRHVIEKNSKCVDCGYCTSLCPVKAISMGKDSKVGFDGSLCIYCGVCVDVCPFDGIRLKPLE
jgi:formate hydrogenlyase subunit 6/NADH:ubiquinone oxidoreductase subunit I